MKKTVTVRAEQKTRKRTRLTKNFWQLMSLEAIPMLLVFVFSYIPMFGIIIAFKDYKYRRGIFGSEWVGLKNFDFLVKSDDFWRVARNTICMNMLFIIAGIVVAVIFAVMLFDVKNRMAIKTYQSCLITPNFISWVVVGYIAYIFLNPEYGTINRMLTALGLPTVQWYNSPKLWPGILTIVSVWKGVGMNTVMYYAALMGIDSEIFEAAELDGANKLQKIWNITIPSLVPIITILFILSIGNIFRADFGLFYQVTRDVGALYETTDVLDTYIFRTMKEIGDMSVSSAVGLLQSVVGFIFVVTVNKIVGKIDPERSLF